MMNSDKKNLIPTEVQQRTNPENKAYSQRMGELVTGVVVMVTHRNKCRTPGVKDEIVEACLNR